MPAARSRLTDEQLTGLREALAGGKRPRVAVSGHQLGGTGTGTVVAIGDPERDGPEFVQVRVSYDGQTDVLGFAPTELALPGSRASAPAPRAPRRERASGAATPSTAPAGTAPASTATTSTTSTASTASTGVADHAPTAAAPSAPAPSAAAAAALQATMTAQRARRPARGGRTTGKPPAPVTVTLRSEGVAWTVSATRGARALVTDAPVPPAAVAAAVSELGLPAVDTAVREVTELAFARARERAAELRRELAAVEAVLQARPAGRKRPAG